MVCCHATGVALKIMRMFRCTHVEGKYWLAADMRLECFTSEWAGYAYGCSLPVLLFTDAITDWTVNGVSLCRMCV
jgi:hypothetical protein